MALRSPVNVGAGPPTVSSDQRCSSVRLIIDNLLGCIAVLDPHLSAMPAIANLATHCQRAAPAWPLLLKAGEEVDRRGAIFSGPLFTSAEHPWPFHDGLWLEPVLQVELSWLGRLRGVPLGEGWLQLWMEEDSALTRIVPVADIPAPLAPVPSLDAQAYVRRLRVTWEPGRPGWLEDGRCIIGFDEPFFDYGTNELLGYIEAALEEALPEPLQRHLRELGEAIEADPDAYRCQHRAFGAVNESDLEAITVPPVLFALEEDEPLRESPNANDGVYLCYEQDAAGDVAFSVHGWNLRG